MEDFNWFSFVRVDNSRRTRRSSSWDRTGGNLDRISLARGQTVTLMEADGAGCVTHIWITSESLEPLWLRKLVLKMYWDGATTPCVVAPLGDFFGVGHATSTTFSSLPMVMAPRDGSGLNCYLPMPFSTGARIEVTSENDVTETRLYYNIDYEEWDSPRDDLGRLHAWWNRENPTDGIADPPDLPDHTFQHAGTNLGDEGNYLLLEAEGSGQYVGCNLNIHPLRDSKVDGWNWYGEGDEMIFVDDDDEGVRWPPTLHGTGTEDYFNTAWGPDQPFDSPFFGLTLSQGHNFTGYISWYRWHLLDPVRFSRRIRVSIEHGHANRRSDDFSSTAYWYQLEPHQPRTILPVHERLPRADYPPRTPPADV